MQVFIMTLIMVLSFGAIVCALPHVVFGIWWAIACLFHLPTPPYAPFGWTALSLVLALWLTMGYGFFFGRFRLWVNHTDLYEQRTSRSLQRLQNSTYQRLALIDLR